MLHDGLRVILTGEQVVAQCATMVTWHAKRKYKYEQELVQLQALKDKDTPEMNTMTNNFGGGMERAAKDKIKEHQSKITWFEYFMKTVNREDEFALNEGDLVQLGFIERNY